MKVSRNELKALVKECLVELLSEGLGSVVRADSPRAPVVESRVRRGERVTLASASAGSTRAVPAGALRDAIKRESGGNPVLAGIFEDTAKVTLPRMIENEGSGRAAAVAGDAATRIVAAHAPEQIFGGEVTDKWAQLAFAPSRPGMRSQIEAQLDT